MRLTERDELILREVDRWRACGSKHEKSLIHVGTGKEKIKTEKIIHGRTAIQFRK